MDFKGRNVLITGGGNGIGAATANKFSGYGANVIVTDWDKAAAESVAKEIVDSGGIALGLKLDVTKIEDWKAAESAKHELEEMQRKDKKLRESASKKVQSS